MGHVYNYSGYGMGAQKKNQRACINEVSLLFYGRIVLFSLLSCFGVRSHEFGLTSINVDSDEACRDKELGPLIGATRGSARRCQLRRTAAIVQG